MNALFWQYYRTFCPPYLVFTMVLPYHSDGDADYDIYTRIGKASWVRMTSPSVEVKNISKNTKMRLYTSIVIASAMYASETWRTTDKTNRMFNVFNRR